MILDLQLNDNLIPLEHFMSYQLPNGDKAIKNFTKTDIDLCHYHVSIFSDLTCWLHKCFSFFSQLGNSGVVAGVCYENGNDRQPRWEFINGTRRVFERERIFMLKLRWLTSTYRLQGKIRNNPLSSVALSTCDGIRGVVFDGLETYYIENEASGPEQQLRHFLIR